MVTNTTGAVSVVETGRKRDTVGRRIVTVAERMALLESYRQSGLTQKAFAKREGVNFSTLAAWLQGRRRALEMKAAAGGGVQFAEVHLPRGETPAGLEVRLPDGTVLRGRSAAELAALVKALRC